MTRGLQVTRSSWVSAASVLKTSGDASAKELTGCALLAAGVPCCPIQNVTLLYANTLQEPHTAVDSLRASPLCLCYANGEM